ncbi:DAO-domain-containing protein [Ascobolus immersus RN42]|uniref:DAO-domain-containing protein n=1 Tax=Ascobolus immersus RN42 TaxID=1160509 RepID=A0A3N4IMS0_ASCIM|nr:DAO-domain-containing protein [Ascobolus immersus RN42]
MSFEDSWLNTSLTEQDPGLPIPSELSSPSFWLDPPDAFLHRHRTTANLPAEADFVILGSGISGAMTALYLYDHHIRRGEKLPKVVMLEAREACGGATGRNGGNCKPAYYAYSEFQTLAEELGVEETVKIIEFQVKNLELLKEIIRQNEIPCDFTPLPSCDAFFNQAAFDSALSSIAHLRRVSPHIAANIKVHKPSPSPEWTDLRVPTAVGAITYNASSLWPYKLICHILSKLVSDCGLNLQTLTPALWVGEDDTIDSTSWVGATDAHKPAQPKWFVSTDRGRIYTPRVIVATNAFTAHLFPQFLGKIFPVRGHCSAFVPPTSMFTTPLKHSYAIIKKDRKKADYLIQRSTSPGRELILGGGRWLQKDNGIGISDDSEVERDVKIYLRQLVGEVFTSETGFSCSRPPSSAAPPQLATTPPTTDSVSPEDLWEHVTRTAPSSPRRWARTTEKSKERRLLKAKAEWTGIMGFSSDGRPWVGEIPTQKGCWVIGGMEGHGMAFATGSAAALVDMIMEDIDAFRSQRQKQRTSIPLKDSPSSSVSSNESTKAARQRRPSLSGQPQGGRFSMNHRKWFPESFRITADRLGVDVEGIEREREERILGETVGMLEVVDLSDDDQEGVDWVVV